MKKMSVKTVVAIGIGAALFFVLGKISIPTPYQTLMQACSTPFSRAPPACSAPLPAW